LSIGLSAPLALYVAKKQLKNVFTDSQVSVGKCEIRLLSRMRLSEIEIKKEKIYDFKLKELRIDYSLISLLRKRILKLSLNGLSVYLHMPAKSVLEFKQHLNLNAPSPLSLDSLSLSGLNLNISSKDLNLKADLSILLNLQKQLLDYCDLKIDSLVSLGFYLGGAVLRVQPRLPLGEFYIPKLKYDKLEIQDLKANAKSGPGSLSLDDLSAKILGGEAQGNLGFRFTKNNLTYLAELRFSGLNLDAFVRDFKLSDRFTLTGTLAGTVSIEGEGAKINILAGDFSTASPGGTLIITDENFLKNLARNSGQSLDILVESFKNYHYNTGKMNVGLDKGNLVMGIGLEGEAGRRDLSITLHDFKLGKGEL